MNAIDLQADGALREGESFDLDALGGEWLLRQGEIELYALLRREGQVLSGRHFIGTLRPGMGIPPYLRPTAGLGFLAIAVTPCQISRIAAEDKAVSGLSASEQGATFDHWAGLWGECLRDLTAPPPTGSTAHRAGEYVPLAAEGVVTARHGVVWFAAPQPILQWNGAVPPCGGNAPLRLLPLSPGLWAQSQQVAELRCLTSAELFGAEPPELLVQALRDWQDQATALLETVLIERREKALQRAQSRARRDEELLRRTAGRFDDILDELPIWSESLAEDQPFLGPFMIIAGALGAELPPRLRTLVGKAKTLESAARSAHLRQRQIALKGRWWKTDLGPLIAFRGTDNRPVALLPQAGGGYLGYDENGRRGRLVTEAAAAELLPIAHMIYAPLPAKQLTLRDLMKFGARRNRRDLLTGLFSGVMLALFGIATPMSMRLALDRFIPSNERSLLAQLGLGLLIVALSSAVMRFSFDTALLRMDARTSGHLFAAVIDRILRMPANALRLSSADLALRASAVNNTRRGITGMGLGAALWGSVWLFNLLFLAIYAPLGALIAVTGAIILLGFAIVTGWRQLTAQRQGEALLSDINTITFQLLNGIGAIRAGGAERRAFARWGQDFTEMRARQFRAQKIGAKLEMVIAGFDALVMAAVLLLLANIDSRSLPVGAFVSFIWSYGTFMSASVNLSRIISGAFALIPGWERAKILLQQVPEDAVAKRDPGILAGAIEMTGVMFRYSHEAPFALAGLSFKVNPGEFVALVGPSGSGKSTAMRLLLGTESPQGGAVLYDGVDLRYLDLDLVRRQIGVVLQNGRLVAGSIFENIIGSTEGTLADAWDAARQAGLEDDIKALPMGMHTILTEATAAFSGGQVQRMMIARALACKPRILLLDEATSALDNVTQSLVTESLARLAVTRIVIGHRLSTVKQADRILVIDRGRVVEQGSFEELMQQNGQFADLARRQLL